MKKNKAFLCVILMSFMVISTGCGDKMISLTDDEATLIANYSAKVISVYNTDQKIGLCNAKISDEELGIVKPDFSPEESYEEPETSLDDGLDEPDTVDPEVETILPDESIDSPISSGFTLSEAVGIDGVDFTIDYFVIDDMYSPTNHFALTANKGCKYVIFTIKASNKSQTDKAIDMMSLGSKFFCEIDGRSRAGAQTTILNNDLSSYQGTIAAGDTEDLVLLFQYKNSVLEQFSTVNLLVERDGVTRSTAK